MAGQKKIKIVICDDQNDVEGSIRSLIPKQIQKAAKISAIAPNDIHTVISTLQKRITAARSSKSKDTYTATELDDADVFIVDYDLIDATKSDYFTGETLAYLARCYSGCGVILALNQFSRAASFDLTLRTELESFADLNLSISDIGNEGLWLSTKWPDYRPWSWPVLPDLAYRLRKRAKDLQSVSLDTPLVEFFEFPPSAIERIPTTCWEAISPARKDVSKSTLRDVIKSPTLGLKGREGSDRKHNADQDTLIVAARLGAWLSSILSTQDVLIDVAHLAARCPSILGSKTKLTNFNELADIQGRTFAKSRLLTPVAFKKEHWLDRPAWYWTEIEKLRMLEEVATPWTRRSVDFVFCEDTSRFVRRANAKSFQSDLQTSYRTRFVEQVANIEYRPLQRLAAG